MLGATISARIVGHEEVPYSSFTDGKGEARPAGVTTWVTLADPSSGETLRCKVPGDLIDQLRPAWWGGEVVVRVRAFAKNNRTTHSVSEVVAVQEPLPGVLAAVK